MAKNTNPKHRLWRRQGCAGTDCTMQGGLMPIRGISNIKKALDDLTINTNDKVRGVMFQALANIQTGTPVDSGRARSNWFISTTAPSDKVTESTSGNNITLEDLPPFVLDKTVYYTNNLPYIERLEYSGWSKQAPSGWVRTELIRAKRALRKI